MAALNPDRTLDFCSANDQSNVEIRFVDEEDFCLCFAVNTPFLRAKTKTRLFD